MNNMMRKSLYDLGIYIYSLILTKILTKKKSSNKYIIL